MPVAGFLYGCEFYTSINTSLNGLSFWNNFQVLLGLGKIMISFAVLSEGSTNQSEAIRAVSLFPRM